MKTILTSTLFAVLAVVWSIGCRTALPLNPQAHTTVGMSGPFGIAVMKNGAFYVAQIDAGVVSEFDAEGKHVRDIRHIEGYGNLTRPFDVEIGDSGNLYIVDEGANNVLIISSDARLLLQLGQGVPTAAPGGFHGPHFIHVDESADRLYVSDTHNHRVQVFNSAGELVEVIGTQGREPGTYHFSGGTATDSKGRLYAMNWSGGFINIYNQNYEFTGTLGKSRTFNDAYSLAIHNDTLWVADTYNNRLVQYDLNHQLVRIVGGQEGDDIHQFSQPTDIGFDGEGNIYVADWKNDRVLKLSPDGHFIRQWGGSEAAANYVVPEVIKRNPCRGPVVIGGYLGIAKTQIDKAAEAGVDWIYPSFNNQGGEWNIRPLVDYAHSRGVRIAPSIAVNYLGRNVEMLQNRPESYMWKKDAEQPSDNLSHFCPDVRRWRARHIAEQARISNVDGILLDYVRYPDVISGYEPAMVNAFREETGRDARAIEPDDYEWLKFRSRQLALFIAELRYELAQLEKPVEVSVYVGPDPQADLRATMRDWLDWVRMGIVDELCIGIYTRNIQSIYEGVRQARHAAPDRIKINAMISPWGGNLRTPELLRQGTDAAFSAGADEVSFYRQDAIDELDLWPTIGELSRRYKK